MSRPKKYEPVKKTDVQAFKKFNKTISFTAKTSLIRLNFQENPSPIVELGELLSPTGHWQMKDSSLLQSSSFQVPGS